MQDIIVFFFVWSAMVATSFWEAYVEGKHAWDEGKLGWKIRYRNHVILTAYHFWLFWVMYPLLLALPLILVGFSWHLFGVLLSAYATGLMIEDFFWFVVNPVFSFKHFNSTYVKWYPWIKIKNFEIPAGYPCAILIAILSYAFIW